MAAQSFPKTRRGEFVNGIPASRFDPQFQGGDAYIGPTRTPDLFTRLFPNLSFYARLLLPVGHLCFMARLGLCDDVAWVRASARVARLLEAVGCPLRVEGMEHISAAGGPCVFVANHMSTLETFVLPSVIRPRLPVTFVVKRSLTRVPAFGAVMRSRDPVVVGRKNPREDLQSVLEGGVERLSRGISVIVFPQSTRTTAFDPSRFNSIGIKLAKRAQAPVVPLALSTDAWGQGKKIKDFGNIVPGKPVHFRFGAPLMVEGLGKAEHGHICRFISESLKEWRS